MPSTRDIRRRIRSVQSTRKITKAMKMVSAAKLRRAQERMLAARPYAHQMEAVLRSLAARANPEAHPLLAVRPEERVELVVMTADKGLCGAFNTNIVKTAQAFLLERREKTRGVHCIGRKGRDFFRRRSVPIAREYTDVFGKLDPGQAQEIGEDLIARFTGNELDAVYMVYNEFKSVIQQRVVVTRPSPDRARRVRRGRHAGGLHLRAGRAHASSTGCSRATSGGRSGTRCSSRRPRSTARGWRRWTAPRRTPTR